MKQVKAWWMDLSILTREHIVSILQLGLMSIATIGVIIGFILYLSQWHLEWGLPLLIVSLISYILAHTIQKYEDVLVWYPKRWDK